MYYILTDVECSIKIYDVSMSLEGLLSVDILDERMKDNKTHWQNVNKTSPVAIFIDRLFAVIHLLLCSY